MSAWLLAASALALGFVPCFLVLVRGTIDDRLVALQLASGLATLELLLIAQGFGNGSAFDAALCLALLSFASSLVYVRFYERWL